MTGRWDPQAGSYVTSRATMNAAGDALSPHIHPIEQGNYPSAFVDRYSAPARPRLVRLHGPGAIRRGAAATVRVEVSGATPVLVTALAPKDRRIAAIGIARRAGALRVTLPARLTALLPAGAIRLVADTGGHSRALSTRTVRGAPVR